MKILKKAGAVLLALAMIAVMIPQLGSTVAKAAGTSYTYKVGSTPEYFQPVKTQSSGDSKILDFAKAFKCGSGRDKGTGETPTGGIKFTGNPDKYAVVEFNMNQKNLGETCYLIVEDLANNTQIGKDLTDQYPDLQISPANLASATVNSEHFMLAGVCEPGEYLVYRDKTRTNSLEVKEVWLCQIKVTEYDTKEEAQAVVNEYTKSITEKPKYTISGKITSEVDLTGGTVSLSTTTAGAKGVTSEPITKNEDGTYSYIANDVVGGGAVYTVSVTAQALTEAKKIVKSAELAKISFTLTDADKTDADFTVLYSDITNTWDFSNRADWGACGYEKLQEVVTYKGLLLDVTTGGKFAIGESNGVGRIQINEKTKVKIPVSGWGSVTCTFTGKVPTNVTTLGETTGDGKASTMTYNYKNAEYVELSIGAGNTGLYLTKIEVVPDTNPAVKTLGASVRQETEAWGNGIRFGGQLDLTKVDTTTCTSGTLIGLAATVGNGNEMTLENVGTTCIDVKRTTFINETDSTLDYAAALINIPDTALDTSIVARPYVIVNEIPYYGEQIETTYNSATKIVNEQ